MRPYLWALAFFCFELTAARPAPAAAPAEAETCESPVPKLGLDPEAELARTGDVYLKLDARCLTLGILASGVELDSVPVAAVELFGYRPWKNTLPPAAVDLPAVWKVEEDLSALSRRVVAPTLLRPRAELGDAPPPALPGAGHWEPVEPPSAYQVRLDRGWVLETRPRPEPHGTAAKIAEALSDGWSRLLGRSLERPSRIVVVMAPEQARRLHHLFCPGTRILVLAGEPA